MRLKSLCLRGTVGGLVAALLLVSLSGCTQSKLVRHRQLLDDAGQAVDHVCVFPLYFKASGFMVAIGAEGTKLIGGRKASEDLYLMSPFMFRSGEDFPGCLLPDETHMIILPPGIFILAGDAVSPSGFLLVREGFAPLLLRSHEKHMREPLVLRRSSEKLPDELLELLSEQRDDQVMLRKYFKPKESVRGIHFEYTSSDVDVVRACLNR